MSRSSLLLAIALAACTDGSDDGSIYPPATANDDQVTLPEDQELALLSLADNDLDVNWVEVVDMPQHGTVEYGKYIPQPGYFGPDQFTYRGRYSEYGGEPAMATAHLTIASDGIAYEQSRMLAETEAGDLAAGDLDGDGKLDLVTCDRQLNEMVVFRNTSSGEGQYAVEPFRFEGGEAPARLAVADFDDDGRLDVITATYEGLAIFRNVTEPQGPLAFAAPVQLGSGITYGVAAADLDGDGLTDLASIESVNSYYDGELHVWLNESTAGVFAFGADTVFATPPAPTRIASVDADDDGRADLAVLGDDKLSVFVNATTLGATVPAFAARIDRGTAPDPVSMFLVDLDGDSRREIGVLHRYGALWIYANRAAAAQTPSFEAARVLDVPYATVLVAPAELDGDGVIDLVGASGETAPFSFLQNRSQPQDYQFELAQAKIADVATRKAASFASPTALSFVDLDGVPPLEIVVASAGGITSASSGLRVLFGP